MYDLLITKNKKIKDYSKFIKKIDGIGNHINVGTGAGGVWTSTDRTNSVNAAYGIIKSEFTKRDPGDPALSSWTTEFENVLMQSYTEQTMYDFKQGFLLLDQKNEFSKEAFSKYIKTTTAIANNSPDITGYLIIGVADSEKDAKRIEDFYKVKRKTYNKFSIFGIEHEASSLGKSLDDYFSYIISQIASEPITDSFKNHLSRNIRLITYFGKSVLVFTIKPVSEPIIYDEKYFERRGNSTTELKPSEFSELFKRFH